MHILRRCWWWARVLVADALRRPVPAPRAADLLHERADGSYATAGGRFVVAPGATGALWFAYDVTRPRGAQCVAHGRTLDAAVAALDRWLDRTGGR